jgi:hypothetical protein
MRLEQYIVDQNKTVNMENKITIYEFMACNV